MAMNPKTRILEAAWDDVTYRDSTDNSNASDTMDGESAPGTTEFEVLYRQMEPRLKFLHTVGSLWGIAAVWISRSAATLTAADDQKKHLRMAGFYSRPAHDSGNWSVRFAITKSQHWAPDWKATSSTTFDAMSISPDAERSSTTVEFLMAERLIGAVISEESITGYRIAGSTTLAYVRCCVCS